MFFTSEVWFDGTYWEADTPLDWSVSRDETVRGWPYVFYSPDGAKLIVWSAFSGGRHQRPSWMPPLPEGLSTEAEMEAYEMTEHNAKLGVSSQLIRCTFGQFVGFTYKIRGSGYIGWEGFFISKRYMLHVRLETPPSVHEQSSQSALTILASVRFCP